MKPHLLTILVLAVTTVLLTLVLANNISGTVTFTVLVVLVVLIMVVGDAERELPEVLRAIFEQFYPKKQ